MRQRRLLLAGRWSPRSRRRLAPDGAISRGGPSTGYDAAGSASGGSIMLASMDRDIGRFASCSRRRRRAAAAGHLFGLLLA